MHLVSKKLGIESEALVLLDVVLIEYPKKAT